MVTTLAEVLSVSVRKHADRVALIVDDRRMSDRELDELSKRVANGLVASGVRACEYLGNP